MEQTKLRNQIEELKQNIEIEKLVSKKIQDFVSTKKEGVDKQEREVSDLREDKGKDYQKKHEDITEDMEKAKINMEDVQNLINVEQDERQSQDKLDANTAADEQKKVQEKLDMEKAARYVQKKWEWWLAVGKSLAKGKKKKKKKNKKK